MNQRPYTILGLGNPGEEYINTRHNTGRMLLEYFVEKQELGNFAPEEKFKALKINAELFGKKISLLLPETFMNKSGETCISLLKKNLLKPDRKKQFLNLIVVHDDLDLPLGRFKIAFTKNSAGHKGVESIIKVLKSQNFTRIRIGISPKKKLTQKQVSKFITEKFSSPELKTLKIVFKKAEQAIETIIKEGKERAMSEFNKF